MFKLSYEKIIEKISTIKNVSKEEIESKIQFKLVELQDLISKEGAAHIIANELGVNLFELESQDLKIKEIEPGQNSINTLGKIINISEIRSFSTQNRIGKVANVMIADETGSIRLTIWDENLIEKIKDLKLQEILQIKNAYSKQNNQGFKELHLGSKSQVNINPTGVIINAIEFTNQISKKQIKDLKENETGELLAYIVQLYEPKFYQACPICNKKVNFNEDHYECTQHGNIPPKQIPIINMLIYYVTSNMRAVCFRDQAEKIIGQNPGSFEIIKAQTVGKQYILKGRAKKNEIFDRTEFTISSIEEPDPKLILKELESAIDTKA